MEQHAARELKSAVNELGLSLHIVGTVNLKNASLWHQQSLLSGVHNSMRVSHSQESFHYQDNDLENPVRREEYNYNSSDCTSANKVYLARFYLNILGDPKVFQMYKSCKKQYFDMTSILPIALFIYVLAATRWIARPQGLSSDGPFFLVTNTAMIVGTVIFIAYFIAHLIIYYTSREKTNQLSYKMSKTFLLFWFGGRIEDVLCILTTIYVGFGLLGRILNGPCEDMTNIWKCQRCNPYPSSFPHDQVMLLYAVPILAQFMLKGISAEAVLLVWACNLIFVLFAIIHMNSSLDIWILLYSILFMNINWEVERLQRVLFAQTWEMQAANDLKYKQKTDYNISQSTIQRLEESSGNERRVAENEKNQLRSMMGNMAHDLKTPLHSIEADLELLNLVISKVPKSIISESVASLKTSSLKQNIDPQFIFETMNATCKFMVMSINRSQDFMKSSRNIALLPAMETFELRAVIATAVICIQHIQPDRLIVVHPFDTEICSHLISDKHWLTENMMCLLSNAMKYSIDGDVDIRIELIESLNFGGNNKDKNSQIRSVRRSMENSTRALMKSKRYICERETHTEVSIKDIKKHMVFVTVEDTGIGISEEACKSLFQPFKQAQRMAGGTGLGLFSLSKRIEALGGEVGIVARSDLKQGSKFWFTFPYRQDEEAAGLAVSEIATMPQREVTFSNSDLPPLFPRNILLIDDSSSVLRVTSRFLLLNGHTVVTATNGCAGLDMLKETYGNQRFDMVITDMQMPVMDGIEGTTRFRSFELEQMMKDECKGIERILIVGMSANSDDQTKQDALSAGMDYFITKIAHILVEDPSLLSAIPIIVSIVGSLRAGIAFDR